MTNYAIRNLTGGELSPSLYARTDLVKYSTGAKTVRNFIVRRQGGLDSRPGTEYVGTCPGVARLLPFVFNADQTYVLEFTDSLLRFIRAGAYVGSPYTVPTPYSDDDLPALQISQSADVVTIVHPSHPVYVLSRLAETNWTLVPMVFGTETVTPTNFAASPAGDGIADIGWVVTAVSATDEESDPSTPIYIHSLPAAPTAHAIRNFTWDAVTGAVCYRVYKGYGYASVISSYGLVGECVNPNFLDDGLVPDLYSRPPEARPLFNAVGLYSAAVGQFQQRLLLAGATNTPETTYTSRTANTNNFTVSAPVQDDDAITFTLVGRRVNQILHLVDNGALLLFTSGGEWVIGGDSAGVIRPTDINALNFSNHGSSTLPPIPIDGRVLYVQARLSIVRDLARDPYRGYQGNDLTLFASHLFTGYTLVDWAYQESATVAWCVRDDGTLLGLTDVAEQEILGWHRHDTDGLFENVCVVPEGTEDAVYVVVNRNGVRMVERFASRLIDDIADAICMDSASTYDGRNADDTKTMTISGGTEWTYDELLTCTCSASEFVSGDVGNAVLFTLDDGLPLLLVIDGVTSDTVVTGYPNRTVPADLQDTATSTWARAVDEVTGLDHLEGKAVSVFADSEVVANPNNPAIDTVVTVTGGVASLGAQYGYIHVGLPYVCDLETLALDTVSGPSLREKRLLINKVILDVVASRGIYAGSNAPDDDSTISPLFEVKLRDAEEWGTPVSLHTGAVDVLIENTWDQDRVGQVFVRQVDPVPLSILAVMPTGIIPPAN